MPRFLILAGLLQNLLAVRPLYLIIWCGLVGLSVALVLLMHSQRSRKHPIYRCALASLLVHVVFVGLTMMVRLVVGDGGAGDGPPIHVKLVDDIQTIGPSTLAAPPQLPVESEQGPIVAPTGNLVASNEVLSEDATNSEVVFEPPPLLVSPEPIAEKQIELNDKASSGQETLAQETPTVPQSVLPMAEAVETVSTEAAAPSEVTEVASQVLSATSPYALRQAADRLKYAEQHGGSVETEAAVAAALQWLVQSQSPDGRWDASRFGAGHEMAVQGQNRGGAGADADSGISALALLALMGAGHTPVAGDYQSNVTKGLEFLMRGQSADGHLASETSLYARMYCHSMATFALAEAFALTSDKRLEPVVGRAVDYSLRAQHPSTGGWRYQPDDTGDTSQLGWQLMSLWSAERAGIKIPPPTWTGAERFLRSVRRGRHGGLASYRADGPASTPMTAEALYCRHLVREVLGGGTDLAAANEATAALLAMPPEPNRVNLYYWYYGTLALHHQQEASSETAAAWLSWNAALTRVLLDSQISDGPEAGSWEPNCVWGGYGGRIYSTAIGAMCLEVYYRYTTGPDYDGWTATGPEVRRLPQ